MAHHIFRRCLFAEVVPPVPPVVAGGDYRLIVSPEMWLVLPVANGVDLGDSVAGLELMSTVEVQPIPPGIDTGLGYNRIATAALDVVISIAGIEIHGATAFGGITI